MTVRAEREASDTRASNDSPTVTFRLQREVYLTVKLITDMNLRSIISVSAVALMVLSCWAAGRKASDSTDGETARKADYIFMEAMRQNALEHPDAYFELMRRSHDLDSTDTEVGLDLGYYYIMLAGEDSTAFDHGMNMMRRHFDSNPDDYYGSIFYGTLVQRMGDPDEALRVWQTLDSLNPGKPDVAIRYGESLMESGDSLNLHRALDVFDRLERSEGMDAGLSSHKVRTYYAMGDTAAIFSELDRLLRYSPRSADNHIYAGDVYRAMSLPDSAIMFYNRACELDPSNGQAYYSRANFYLAQGDTIGYGREIYEALRQSGLDDDTKLELLKTYTRDMMRDSVQRPRIRELFEELITQRPHDNDVRDLYAGYFMATEQYADAAEQMSYTLDIDPSNEDRWRTLIGLHMQSGQYDRAVTAGKTATHYFPTNAMLYMLTGSSEAQARKYDDAIADLQRAYDLGAESGDEFRALVLCSIGDTYSMMQQTDSAMVYYERTLQLDPNNYLAMNNMAYFLACQERDLDRAEALVAEAVRAEPDNATSLDTYAWVFFKKKEYAKALEYINEALKFADKPQAEELDHAGDINFMNGNRDEALDFWRQALSLDPDNELLQRKVRHRTIFFK